MNIPYIDSIAPVPNFPKKRGEKKHKTNISEQNNLRIVAWGFETNHVLSVSNYAN